MISQITAARHAGQVATGFGVPGAHQHPAVHGLQRKDVARLDQIPGPRVPGDGGLHGTCPVAGGNAGGHALGGLDRDGERRGMLGAVARHHRRQAQPFAVFAGEGQADQAAAEARHEVDRFRRDVLGGQHEVALVLAILFVDQDHHAAGTDIGDDLVHGRNRHAGKGFGSVHALPFKVGEGAVSIRST